MEISFIHSQILVHLHVNKTNFYMKGFPLTRTRFETESEVAYWSWYTGAFVNDGEKKLGHEEAAFYTIR